MKPTRFLSAALAAFMLSTAPVLAQDITVQDAYVRSSTLSSPTGAAFFMLMNGTDQDDRLIAATTDAAERAELHTHTEDANGVMKMSEIEGGIAVPAQGTHAFDRGGDHIMLMGLKAPLVQGAEIAVTLTFEKAGDVTVMIPVDQERRPDHGATKQGG